jgi:hypothetical protein
MGVIKGSEQTLDQADGFLDRNAYENLSHRSQATFANQRENIYSLFRSYLKLKRAKRHYDAPDRFVSLKLFFLLLIFAGLVRSWDTFAKTVCQDKRLTSCEQIRLEDLLYDTHFCRSYVDEVQDNLLIDSLRALLIKVFLSINFTIRFPVLRYISRNRNGLFWAGDTAQVR